MPESTPSNVLRPIDATPIRLAQETPTAKPQPWWKRQLNRIGFAVRMYRIHHGMDPLTKREITHTVNRVTATMRALYNASSIIEGLTFEQTTQQIWKKYPNGIEEMRQRLGITIPYEEGMGLPLTPEQEEYLQQIREQAGKYPLGLEGLRTQMQLFNYIEAYYEKHGDKSLKPDDELTR